MLFPKLTPRFALSFILLIIATVLSLSTFVDLNSYAESHDNNNKNISSLSSLSPSPISNGEELKKSRDAIDVNTSSSSASSSSESSSDSSNETSDNKPQLGTLVVMKQVINEGGGDKKPSDFTITVSGNNPTPSSFAGSSSGTTVTVNEGSYNVKEEGPYTSPDYVPGRYTPSYSSECAGTIQAGKTVSCTISNKYNPFIPGILSKLIVTKKVVNEGGGDKKPSDFTITVSGNNPTPSSFAGSSSGTTVTLNPGRYSVTENLISGYTSSMIG